MASKDTNVGAKRARQTREALGLDPAAPLDCVLTLVESALEVPVVIAALPTGIAGCRWRDGERVVLWINGTHAPVRQRFTLAHELGHVRCGHDGTIPVETFRDAGREDHGLAGGPGKRVRRRVARSRSRSEDAGRRCGADPG